MVAPAIIGGGLSLLGGVIGASKQASATRAAAQAQIEAAKLASRFRGVGITTPFAESRFTVQPDYIPQTDPVTGEPVLDASGQPVMIENPEAGFLSGAEYALTPELAAQQAGMMGLLPTALGRAQDIYATTPYQELSEQYLGRAAPILSQMTLDPTQAAAERTARLQALQAPGRAETQEALFSNLAAKGLTGLGVTTGTGATVNPYMAALQEAQAAEDARIASESLDRARADIAAQLDLAGGLLGSAQQLEGYEAGRAATAFAPYQSILGTAEQLDALARQPLTLGAQLGGTQQGLAGTLASGLSDAARTTLAGQTAQAGQIAGLFGGIGDMYSQYAASQPQTVTGGLMAPGAGVMMPQQPAYNPYAANFNFSLPTPAPTGAFGPYSGGYGQYGASYAAPYQTITPMPEPGQGALQFGQGANESFYLSP